ncbi:hypothetical protein TYRP_017279 [Tyrophagus putrescentiae]|nr:hypothetical protein TYRP_017279 [Tyrophagus putrescentiae]
MRKLASDSQMLFIMARIRLEMKRKARSSQKTQASEPNSSPITCHHQACTGGDWGDEGVLTAAVSVHPSTTTGQHRSVQVGKLPGAVLLHHHQDDAQDVHQLVDYLQGKVQPGNASQKEVPEVAQRSEEAGRGDHLVLHQRAEKAVASVVIVFTTSGAQMKGTWRLSEAIKICRPERSRKKQKATQARTVNQPRMSKEEVLEWMTLDSSYQPTATTSSTTPPPSAMAASSCSWRPALMAASIRRLRRRITFGFSLSPSPLPLPAPPLTLSLTTTSLRAG